jgi:uroporphyrinogen decarboxylase
MTIQGNLDPSILFGSPEHIEKETKAILTQMAGDPRHIFNLGHGISQHTLPEHAKIMIDTVHDYSHKLREALRKH